MSKVEDSIERIMQATIQVAFEKGFANTRTADIAKKAGVSEGLIFKYFPTKSHLFTIIIKGTFQRIKAGAEVIINDVTLTATAKLNALIDFHFDFFTKQANIAFLILGHSDRKNINLAPVIEYGLKPYTQLLSKILNEGINSGEFRPFNVDVIGMSILGTMQFNLIAKILFGNPDDIGAIKSEIKEYILSGIKAVN